MRPFKCTGTFDIESADWDRPVLGVCYDGHLPKVFHDCDRMIDHMRRIGGIWFAHAGGVYDLLYVLERCRDRGISCQVDRSQHRVTRIVIGNLTLRDSYSLWPTPLDDLCGFAGLPVPHLPWKCICGKQTCGCGKCGGCGGYCRIGERAAEGDPDLEAYCIADCRALYDALHLLDEWAVEHKIALRGTLGQTAWVAAQREVGVPDSDIPWHLYRHIKQGDKGGRVAIVRPFAAGPGSHHDICNAYPAQLAHASLPIGACRELGDRDAMRALMNQRPGIYTLTVQVQDDLFLPPLPWEHGGQQWFPTGTFTGSWPLPEIAAALERGVAITACHAAVIWETTAPLFAELVKRWYEIRRQVGRKTPQGQWIGRLAKAFTGKLAERPERNRVTMHPASIKVCLRKGRCKHGCTLRCGAYEQIDLYGKIWTIPYQRLGASSYPQWSAYLRAQTRVQWLEQAERYGENLCLGNTDSIWSLGRGSPEPLGDGLGEWEFQGTWTELEIRSPTVYAFRDDKGAMQVRGVPGLTEEDWKRGHGVIDRGVVTFGRAVGGTRGLFTKRQRRWSLPGLRDRVWYGDRRIGVGGVTVPADAQEIRELVADRTRRSDARKEATERALRPGRG